MLTLQAPSICSLDRLSRLNAWMCRATAPPRTPRAGALHRQRRGRSRRRAVRRRKPAAPCCRPGRTPRRRYHRPPRGARGRRRAPECGTAAAGSHITRHRHGGQAGCEGSQAGCEGSQAGCRPAQKAPFRWESDRLSGQPRKLVRHRMAGRRTLPRSSWIWLWRRRRVASASSAAASSSSMRPRAVPRPCRSASASAARTCARARSRSAAQLRGRSLSRHSALRLEHPLTRWPFPSAEPALPELCGFRTYGGVLRPFKGEPWPGAGHARASVALRVALGFRRAGARLGIGGAARQRHQLVCDLARNGRATRAAAAHQNLPQAQA